MINKAASAPSLADIRAAADALAPYIIRSPLLQLETGGIPGDIFLKLENLQAIGAFKVRPIGNVLLNTEFSALRNGVYTASSGNAGIGLAWFAKQLVLAATVYAPDNAPAEKLAAIKKLGAETQLLSAAEWWQITANGGHPHDPGEYVDAVRNPSAIAGNGTIGMEIFEQAPDVDTVIVPFGGGGLCCGIAAAMRALKPGTRIVVAESDAATPLTAALEAGRPVAVEVAPSPISGAGAPSVLEDMWLLVRELVDDTVVVPVADVIAAMRILFDRHHLVAEGAGATALAAALATKRSSGKTVCIVSGGNIDRISLHKILDRNSL